MGAKRNKYQILARILETCQGEEMSKTNIVYASGLNFKTILSYLSILNRNGLIEIIPGKYPFYKTTPKGEDALIHLKALEEIILLDVPDNGVEIQGDVNSILAEKQGLTISPNGRNLEYASRLENDIFNKISSIYLKMREENVRDIKSKTLEFLKFKLLDLAASNVHVKWLEIGCGDGKSLDVLDVIQDRSNFYYQGIDTSYKYLDEAQKKAEKYGIDHNIEKRSPAKKMPEKEYDIEIAISVFHRLDPICLPYVLRNLVQALKDDGTIIISDFEELYDKEDNVVNWGAEDIEYILHGIYGNIYFNAEYIPASLYPNELSFYRGIIKKSDLDNNRFDEFMKTYERYMETKKEKTGEKIVVLKNQIGIRVGQILKTENIDIEKISEVDLSKVRDGIEDEYGIKALKIELLTKEMLYIEDKIEEFKKGGICSEAN